MPFFVLIFFGIFSAIFAFVFEFLLLGLLPSFLVIENSFSLKTLLFFLVFAFIEESAKYLFLFQYKRFSPAPEKYPILRFILMAICFGVGFFLLEYIVSSPFSDLFTTTLPRIFIPTLLLHIITSFFLILNLFRSHISKDIFFQTASLGVGSMTILHLIYNSVLFFL